MPRYATSSAYTPPCRIHLLATYDMLGGNVYYYARRFLYCYGHVRLPDNADMRPTSFAGVSCCVTVCFLHL